MGLIPVAGNAADAANAVISTARGNYEDAVLDATSAIPVGGQVTGVANAGIKLERGVSGILAGIAGMRRVPKVVQTGGRTLQPGTVKILNEQNGVDFRPDQWPSHREIQAIPSCATRPSRQNFRQWRLR